MMSGIKNVIKKHPLLSFAILAYLITAVVDLPVYTTPLGVFPFTMPEALQFGINAVGTFGPTIAAIIVAWTISGMSGVRDVLKRLTIWKVGLKWYAAAIGIPLIAFACIAFLYPIVTGTAPQVEKDAMAWALSAGLAVIFTIFGGPLGEESGWRGFALPRMLKKWDAFTASVLLGLLWFGWHLPSYINPVMFESSGGSTGIIIFAVFTVALTILMTWVFQNAKGSTFLTFLFHGANNLLFFLYLFYPGINYHSPIVIGTAAAVYLAGAVLVVAYYGRKSFMKKAG